MKKKLLQKLLSLSLVAVMAIGTLSGCGDKAAGSNDNNNDTSAESTQSSADDKEEETAPAETADSGEKTKIAVYRATFNLASPDSAQVQKVQDAVNEYIGDKINVEITLEDVGSGEYGDKANLALSNGEINLLWSANWAALPPDSLYNQNAAYDITDLLPGTLLYDSMPEAIWDSASYDGRTYFVPIYKESAEGYDLVLPQRLVDTYGWDLSSIKELKDIEPMLEDCKSEGLKYPFLTQMMNLFYRFYIDKYDFFSKSSLMAVDRETDTVVNTIQTDDYADFCKLMCRWGALGYISDEEVTKTTPATAIMTEDWGFAAWVDVPDNGAATTTYGQECAIVPLTDRWSHSTSTLGSCYAVTSACTEEQAKACVDFLGLLYTDNTLGDLWTYGIEGTDYDIEDGYVVKKGGLYDHSAWESTSIKALSLETGDPENRNELYEAFNEKSQSSCASGFRFDGTSVEAQNAACTNVYNQYGYVLEQGGYNEDEVDSILQEFQQALDEAGYQDILTEAQNQYEAWKTTR